MVDTDKGEAELLRRITVGQPGNTAAASRHTQRSPAADGAGGETMAEGASPGGCGVLRGIFARNLGGYKPEAPPSYGGVTLEQCCTAALDGGLDCIHSLGPEHEGIMCDHGEEAATRGIDQLSVGGYIAYARKKTSKCCVSAQKDLFELRHAGTVSVATIDPKLTRIFM